MVDISILIGGITTPLKNMKINGKDYPINGENKNVPNHQPAGLW